MISRPADALHRLEVIPGERAISLFVTGPRVREWGFACPHGWVHWRDFTSPDDSSKTGRGCGEPDALTRTAGRGAEHMSGQGGPLGCARCADQYAEVESYVTGPGQRPLEVLETPEADMRSAADRVTALLAADPVCGGRVARATIRSLAFMIVSPPAPLAIDGAAERAATRAHLSGKRRAIERLIADDPHFAELGADRLSQLAALDGELAQGLHDGVAVGGDSTQQEI